MNLLFCSFFFSALFWMKNTVDYLGWSLLECAAIFLLLRLLFKKQSILLPTLSVSLCFLTGILWNSLSLFWSSNFHATLTSIYKLFFILILLIVFINEKENWQSAFLLNSKWFGSLIIALILFLPAFFEVSGMSYPNLFSGCVALMGILWIGDILRQPQVKTVPLLVLILSFGVGLFLFSSLAPLIAWILGVLCQFLIYQKKGAWIFILILLSLFSFSLLALKKGEAASKNPLQQLWQRKSLDPYAGERLQIWNDCWNYFLDQPLQGTGLGTFRDHYPQYKTIPGLRLAPYAHNEWLNILCETGTIGALILLGLGALLLKTIRNQKERWHEWGIWMGVVAGAFSQGTLDFSLRYAPVLLFVLIALATILPVRTTEIRSQKIKTGLWISFSLLGILFALPGIADCIFKIHAPHPDERKEGALIASVLDPFNALYRSQTGRMRDLVIAMDLEPRNVWYHREAVLWYLQEWKRSKNVTFLKTALEEYKKILRMAPNVAEFQKEYRELFSTMTSQ